MYPSNISELPTGVRERVAIERRIVRKLVNELLSKGLSISVDDGEETYARTTDNLFIFEHMMETDEDRLHVFEGTSAHGKHLGTIMLVYGNDGWDVMSDWHTSLDQYMPETLALVEKLS